MHFLHTHNPVLPQCTNRKRRKCEWVGTVARLSMGRSDHGSCVLLQVTVRVEFVVQATNVPNTPTVTVQGQVIVGHNTMDTNQANNGFQFMWRVVPAADASISM